MVDIIILVHTEAKITRKCLEKLFKHTKEKDFRLIIVDNGADVETKRVVKEYLREQDDYIQLFSNIGFAKGVNRGMEKVTSPYFCLLNNDVLVSSNWLTKMKKKLDSEPNIGAIGAISNFASGKQVVVPEDQEQEITDQNYESFEPTLDPLLILDPMGKQVIKVSNTKKEIAWPTNVLAFFAVMFKSEVLKKVGKLDEQFSPAYSEDWDYCFRMLKEKYVLLVDRETFVFHYGEITTRKVLGSQSKFAPKKMYEDHNQLLKEKWGANFINSLFNQDRNWRRIDPTSVTIAFPNPGMFSHYAFLDALTLMKPGHTAFSDLPRMVIHFARNEGVKASLLNGTNWIFYIDADTKYPPEILIRLLSYKKDMVAAIVTKRVPPYNPCVYKGRKKLKNSNKMGWKWLTRAGIGLREVDAVGMAATLINMKVFKKMKHPWFYFTKDIGEDLGFCGRLKKAGFEIFCDTNIACLHEGEPQWHGWDDFKKWAEKSGGKVIEVGPDENVSEDDLYDILEERVQKYEEGREKKDG